MHMDLTLIIIAVLACAGLVFFFPKMPQIAQIIAAIVGVIACAIVLMRLAGVDLHF